MRTRRNNPAFHSEPDKKNQMISMCVCARESLYYVQYSTYTILQVNGCSGAKTDKEVIALTQGKSLCECQHRFIVKRKPTTFQVSLLAQKHMHFSPHKHNIYSTSALEERGNTHMLSQTVQQTHHCVRGEKRLHINGLVNFIDTLTHGRYQASRKILPKKINVNATLIMMTIISLSDQMIMFRSNVTKNKK